MYTGSFMVRGVIAEIAREIVKERIDAIHARILLISRVQAGVVSVCNPGSVDERQETGKQDHKHGICRIEVERKPDDRPQR